ncbi:DUF4397 domain-containing protein [Saliterribacillus persicus]|uniref:Uncharacterized protein DUF4397 n=1 Tax=Saliterribacillus persicus TaxID=930114 RepID=A0A368YAQ1_9BACI|nr:DUF4397 domain-containing protein [Saliterribacillus persicus]RCW77282.1 uncharacterized protein DUF4397 [Saliterribacillus persicus]
MKKVFALLVSMVLVSSLFAGTVFADDHENAMVRILHASPDAPEVDVYLNGDAVVEGAGFKAATDYMEVPAGEHEVEIYPAGTMDEAVISETLTVEAGMAYTVAATGMLDSLELTVGMDSMEVADGMTKVRVGHLSPDAPTVDVGLIDGDTLFEGATFPAITDYMELDAGTYDLEIRTAEGDQVLDLSGTTLEENTVYSVFAVNTAENLEVLMLEDYSGSMPSEMPQTGLGGAQGSNMALYGLMAMLGGLVLAGFGFRRKANQQ